jgi:hypothetical protein
MGRQERGFLSVRLGPAVKGLCDIKVKNGLFQQPVVKNRWRASLPWAAREKEGGNE